MIGEATAALAVAQEKDEAPGDGSMGRLHEWIAALEADRARLSHANEERAARERQLDLRYLEFVREVLR